MQFGFYRELPEELIRPFQFQDKSYVEYRANPDAAVTITWKIVAKDGSSSEEVSEAMRNVYEGVFVKDFTLFYGDRLLYRIREERGEEAKETEEQTLSFVMGSRSDSSYDLINRLAEALDQKNENTAKELMSLYLEQECMASHIFLEND
jgi:hypothetical protein